MRGTLFADAPDGLPRSRGAAFAVVDARGTVTNWTPGAERLLGWTAAEARGPVSRLLWSRPDGARVAGIMSTEHSVFLGPLLLRHRDGEPVGVVLWGHPLAQDRWLLQAENAEAVRQDDLLGALLRGLFTESPFIIDVFDTDLRFLARNDSQIRATGFPEDFVGCTMREVAPPGLLDPDAFEARQRLVLSSGRAMIGSEVRGRDPATRTGTRSGRRRSCPCAAPMVTWWPWRTWSSTSPRRPGPGNGSTWSTRPARGSAAPWTCCTRRRS